LAIQKIGGAQPQNVSQLNSERRGVNYLFPSLPPVWVSRPVRPPKGDSLGKAFGQRPEVYSLTQDLKKFLKTNPKPNQETRAKRNQYLSDIIGEFIVYCFELKALPSGWTREAACCLPQEEKDWLEPDFRAPEGAAEEGADEALKKVIHRFANWLNSVLSRKDKSFKDKPLPVGEVEQAFWADALTLALKEADLDQQA
jgi:CRISPR-associated protein Csy1